ILYELLTGRPPFQAATVLETLEQVRSVEPVEPTRLRRRLPRDLATICLKCLEKEPARRYAAAAELAEDLRRVEAGGANPGRARGVARTDLAVGPAGGGGRFPGRGPARGPHWRGHPVVPGRVAPEGGPAPAQPGRVEPRGCPPAAQPGRSELAQRGRGPPPRTRAVRCGDESARDRQGDHQGRGLVARAAAGGPARHPPPDSPALLQPAPPVPR